MSILNVSEHHKLDEKRNIIVCCKKGEKEEEKKYQGIDIKIEIYEARVNGWFFDDARKLVANGMATGDYIAVMVALSYIEGVEQFRKGEETPKGKSGEWFKEGAKRIFPDQPKEVIDRLWKETRCGLFHAGFPNGKIYLSHDRSEAIKREDGDIFINPNKFVDLVATDFSKYINDLNNVKNLKLRENFEKLWDNLWGKS